MRRFDVHEAESQLARIREEVELGERVVIARAAVARHRRLGLFACEAKIADDFDQIPDDIAAALGADSR